MDFNARPDIKGDFNIVAKGSTVLMAKEVQSQRLIQFMQLASQPEYSTMIYSNTGSDDAFDVKLSFYGWGTFYVADSGDAYCHLEVRKGINVEGAGLSKKFEIADVWETLIPSSTILKNVPVINTIAVSYINNDDIELIASGYVKITDMYDVFYTNDSGVICLKGVLHFSGDGTLWWKES